MVPTRAPLPGEADLVGLKAEGGTKYYAGSSAHTNLPSNMQKNHEGHKECETVNLMYSNPKVVVNWCFGMHCQPPEGGTTTHGGW
ncbi:MAG: hypothetical protein ACLFVO_20230, partial [Chloroflexaceae bacterium]